MRQKLLIFAALFLLILVLIGLNAASYTQKEKELDSELSPNRSSYNSGVTGTLAFYDLLSETGRKVVRWQEPPDALLANKNAPQTFVVIGSLRREFSDGEIKNLLQWVSGGGKLVVIDREPPEDLVKTTADWNLSVSGDDSNPLLYSVDASDQKQMTDKIAAVNPVQPTVYTQKVNAVQPSIFASSLVFEAMSEDEKNKHQKQISGTFGGVTIPPPPPPAARISPNPKSSNQTGDEYFKKEQPIMPPTKSEKPSNTQQQIGNKQIKSIITKDVGVSSAKSYPPAFTAPVVHLSGNSKNLLVDVPYNSGEIVYLTDPFIVSNNGIKLVDNAQIAINIVGSREGTIAFDEYHQGFGATNNRFLEYFAGTPVVSIFLQIALLILLLFISQSRRFARAVPEYELNRLSKLEYVSAMAELQQRARAFDLAIENIYTDFRRRAARLLGADNYAASKSELARLIAERTKFDRAELEDLMQKCEDIMYGAATSKKEVLRISSRLREIEEKLGMRRAGKTKV